MKDEDIVRIAANVFSNTRVVDDDLSKVEMAALQVLATMRVCEELKLTREVIELHADRQ